MQRHDNESNNNSRDLSACSRQRLPDQLGVHVCHEKLQQMPSSADVWTYFWAFTHLFVSCFPCCGEEKVFPHFRFSLVPFPPPFLSWFHAICSKTLVTGGAVLIFPPLPLTNQVFQLMKLKFKAWQGVSNRDNWWKRESRPDGTTRKERAWQIWQS